MDLLDGFPVVPFHYCFVDRTFTVENMYNHEKKYDDNDKICQRKLTMINMDNNTYTNMVMIKFDDTDHSISHSREQSSDPIPSLSLFNLC